MGIKKGSAGNNAGSEKQNQDHLLIVDALKGICIIMVILTHVNGLAEVTENGVFDLFVVKPAVPVYMILSAFVFTLAENRRSEKSGSSWSISDWFESSVFYPRLRRFLLPFLFTVVLLTMGLLFLLKLPHFGLRDFWKILYTGGRGPGTYYIILLLEFLLVFPFVKYWIDIDPFGGTLGSVLLTVAFESMVRYVWHLSDTVYDRMIFRFLTHMAMGILLAKYRTKILDSAIPAVSLIIGIIYRVNLQWLGYRQVLRSNRFGSSAFLFAFYCFAVICFSLRLEPWARRHPKLLMPLCFLGNASYHILLAQMLYFYTARSIGFEESLGSLPLIILADCAISLLAGSLFYLAWDRFAKILRAQKTSGPAKPSR